ncbi:MAG: ATP-binding protein [Candidatus Lokiarchaeia archaeon]
MNYQYEELKLLAEKLGIDRAEISNCLEKAARKPENIQVYRNHFLKLLKKEGYLLHDLPAFGRLAQQDNFEGKGIHVGHVVDGRGMQIPFYLPFDIFTDQHVLISGLINYGKSHLAKLICYELIKAGKKVIILDSEDEYSHLCQFFPPEVLLSIDPRELKLNLIKPFRNLIDPVVARGNLINVMRESLFLRDGSCNLLDSCLMSLEGRENSTLLDLYNTVMSRSYKPGTRHAQYNESLQNRLEMFLNSYLSPVFLCVEGHPLEDIMLKSSIIIRVGKISNDLVLSFFVNFILNWIQTYLEYYPEDAQGNVILLEEVHRFTFKGAEKRSDLREPIIISTARQIRKRHVSLVFINQLLSDIPKPLIGVVNTLISFRLINNSCIKILSDACGLYPEQSESISKLPKRVAMVFGGEFSQPYLIRTKDFEIHKISEEHIRDKMEPLLSSFPYIPLPEQDYEVKTIDSASPLVVDKVSQKKVVLKPRRTWKDILEILIEVGFIGLSELYKSLRDVSPFYGRKVIKEMESLDLIESCTIGFGKRGNATTFILMRPKGAEFLSIKYEDIKLLGKGSTEHKIIQNFISRGLNDLGKVTSVEHSMNGKSVDIAEFVGDRIIAYELELDPQAPHILQNINKDLEAGFSEVVIISKNKIAENEIKDQIYRHLDWTQLSKVKFKLLREFV